MTKQGKRKWNCHHLDTKQAYIATGLVVNAWRRWVDKWSLLPIFSFFLWGVLPLISCCPRHMPSLPISEIRHWPHYRHWIKFTHGAKLLKYILFPCFTHWRALPCRSIHPHIALTIGSHSNCVMLKHRVALLSLGYGRNFVVDSGVKTVLES